MSDGSEVVYSYVADSSGVMDAIDEVSAGIQSLIEDINGLVEASSALGEFSGIFEEIAAIFTGVDEAAMEATSGIASMAEEAGVAADALSALGADSEGLVEVGAAANEAGIDFDALAAAVDNGTMSISEYIAAVGGLDEEVNAFAQSMAEASVSVESLTVSEVEAEAAASGLGEALSSAQGPLMMLSMAGIAAGAAMFNMGSKAEDALNQVQALAGVGSAQMAQYTSQLEEQSTQFGESLDQEAQGLFYVTSAGFQGAGAMKVLAQSVMDAKAGNIDLATSANGLTTVLNAYGVSADQASKYNDIMVTAVTNGKQTFQDFATSIAKAAVEGNAAHISFNQVAAAEAALTDQGLSARNASNALTSMMRAMDANIDKTADTATKLGLSFNETAFKSMDLFHQMQYLQDITKGNQTELSKLVGGATGVAAFNALMTKSSDGTYKFATILDTMKNSTGAAAQAFQASQETISAHMAKLQASLSVISYKALEALAPTINAVADAVGKAADFISEHMDIVMPILAGLAAMFGTIIVAAIAAFLAPMWTVVAPFLAVAAVIGAVVAGIVLLVQHWGELTSALGSNPIIQQIMKVFQDLGGYITSAFAPLWQQLQDLWKNQIVPAGQQLMATFKQIQPELTMLAEFVGGVLVVAFGFVVGAIAGFAKGVAGFASGLIEAFGGIVQYISGLIQVISGIVSFIVDLLTGRFDKLSGDLGIIWGGIQNMFKGFANTVKGIFDGLVKGVEGEFSGFADGITGYFNQILHGSDNKTKAASIAAQTNTAEMKDKSIANAQSMNEQMQMKFINMRNNIEDQLRQTTDVAQKHTLQMKLNTVNNSLEMAQKAGQNIVDMRQKSLEQVELLKQGVDVKLLSASDLAKYHSLNMKDQYLGGVISMETQTIQKMDDMRLGIINELSKTTDETKKHTLEIKLTQVTHAEDAAKQVAKKHVEMRANVENEMDKFKKSASDKFGSIQKDVQNIVGATGKWFEDRWNEASKAVTDTFGKMGKGIQDAVGSVGKWIQDKWNEAVNGVVGHFEYLYKHSYLFQAIVDNIHNAFNAVVKFLEDTWKKASDAVKTGWNASVKWVQDTWKSISDTFSSAWGTYVSGPLSALWTNVSTFFSNTWTNYVSKPLSDMWSNVSKAFSNAWTDHVSKPLSDTGKSISDTVSGWATSAWQWGVNLITGLANGISSAVKGALHTALTDAANTVKALIGWHSPTEEGPGSDSDTWAPALMNMFINGIKERQAQLKQAMDSTAAIVSDSLSMQIHSQIQTTTATLPQGPSAANSASNAQIAQILQQFLLQQQSRQQVPQPTSANLGAVTQHFSGGINFSGVPQDINALFQMLNQLSGLQFEYGQRGATFNY